jgi:hypothetical protein
MSAAFAWEAAKQAQAANPSAAFKNLDSGRSIVSHPLRVASKRLTARRSIELSFQFGSESSSTKQKSERKTVKKMSLSKASSAAFNGCGQARLLSNSQVVGRRSAGRSLVRAAVDAAGVGRLTARFSHARRPFLRATHQRRARCAGRCVSVVVPMKLGIAL